MLSSHSSLIVSRVTCLSDHDLYSHLSFSLSIQVSCFFCVHRVSQFLNSQMSVLVTIRSHGLSESLQNYLQRAVDWMPIRMKVEEHAAYIKCCELTTESRDRTLYFFFNGKAIFVFKIGANCRPKVYLYLISRRSAKHCYKAYNNVQTVTAW